MSTVREEIAKNLMFFRKKAGLTQRDLAERLNVRNTSISNWENARSEMGVDTLYSICKILNVSASDMFGVYAGDGDDYDAHEKAVLDAYRRHPELRPAVDKLLDVQEDAEKKTALPEDPESTVRRIRAAFGVNADS